MANIERYRRGSLGILASRPRTSAGDISGMVQGAQQFASSAAKIEDQRRELEEKRLARIDRLRVMNQANKLTGQFRDRYFETSQVKGEDALTLYDTESQYVQNQRENYANSLSGLDPDTAQNMLSNFDRIANSYLGRVSEYTRSEAKRFEKKVLDDTAVNATQQAIDSEVGNFQAIEGVASNINNIYSGFPDEQVKRTDEAILETYRQWTIINPDKSIRSYEANKKRLQELMGDRYAQLDGVIQTAIQARENRIAERQKQLEDDRKKYIDDFNDSALNTIVAAQRGNEDAKDDMLTLQERIMTDPVLPATGVGGKQWWITNMQNIRDSVITRDYVLLSSYYDKAYEAAITEDDQKRLWHNVSIGRMSADDAKGVLAINKAYTEKPEDVVGEAWKEEYKSLKGMMLGKGLITGAGPDHHYALAQARGYVQRELEKQLDVQKKLDMLDPLSKNYIIEKAYNKYRVPDTQALENQARRINPGAVEFTEEAMDKAAGFSQ